MLRYKNILEKLGFRNSVKMLIFANFMASGSKSVFVMSVRIRIRRGQSMRIRNADFYNTKESYDCLLKIISGGGEVRGGSEAESGGRLCHPLQCLHQDT